MFTTVQELLRAKGNEIFYVSPNTTVLKALKFMAEKNIGALLVLEDDKLAGIVSERDFVRKISEINSCDPDRPVSDYMTRKVITISHSQNIKDCMEIMTDKRIRHLPVVEGGKVIGVISIGDVVKSIINSQEFTIEQLQNYISGGGYNQ